MDYQELASSIRQNAKNVLELKNIEASLQTMGQLFYTGSYVLDLMTWNDIDMQLILNEGLNPIEALGNFFLTMTEDPDFIEAQLIHFKEDYKPKMPRGVYLGLKINCPSYGGIWKLDVWVLSKEDFEKNQELMNQWRSKLDASARKLILQFKHNMMDETGRMPQMGSYLLYQAVLMEGVRDPDSLRAYFDDKRKKDK